MCENPSCDKSGRIIICYEHALIIKYGWVAVRKPPPALQLLLQRPLKFYAMVQLSNPTGEGCHMLHGCLPEHGGCQTSQ